jgi:hypothetical protein
MIFLSLDLRPVVVSVMAGPAKLLAVPAILIEAANGLFMSVFALLVIEANL